MAEFKNGNQIGSRDDYFMNISRGKYNELSSIFKFGRNPNTGVTETIVWDGATTYHFLDSAETMNISSDDIRDSGVTLDDGAWDIKVYGLDDNFNEINETLILNGTTPITTTKAFRRVFRAYILHSGLATATEDANLGSISITSSTTGFLQAKILPNNGQTSMAIYTVPRGKTAYITGATFNVGQGKQCLFRGKFRNCETSNCSFSTKHILDVYENTHYEKFSIPLRVEEMNDIIITAQLSSTPNTTVVANWEMILEDNCCA